MSKLSSRQLEAFTFGLNYLSPKIMRELLLEIMEWEINEIEDCIDFTYDTRVKIGDKILESLRNSGHPEQD